jgi:SPFH domain/Band 7 family protein/double zinc ribbon protein
MGFFSDRCQNPECGYRVKKGSTFCPKCGTSAPKGLTRCGQCGAEVGTASKFCWRCGCDLAEAAKPMVYDDRWARRAGDFAVRLQSQDVKGWLSKPLIIEHGTRAMMFQNGKYRGELNEGRHDMGGFLTKVNHFLIDQPADVILFDGGDISLDLENPGLWTSDEMEVGTASRAVLRVQAPDSFFQNLLKARNRIGTGEIRQELADEVQMALAGIVNQHTADELFRDPNIRDEIEAALRETLTQTLSRIGMQLVQVRFISFGGEAYEALRQERGELRVEEQQADIQADRYRLAQRMREALTQERMDEFKTEQDFEGFVRQVEHELGLKNVLREDEMDRLKERLRFDRDREGILRRIEIQGIEDDNRRERAWKELLEQERHRDEQQQRELQRDLGRAQNDAEKRKIELELQRLEHAEDMRQAEDGQRLLSQQNRMELDRAREEQEMEIGKARSEQEIEAQRLEARSKATAEALLSIVDGPAADRIAQLEELRRKEGMSPEQILALTAGTSPEAARTLAKKYEAEGQLSSEKAELLERQMADQRQMAEDHANRLERLMQISLEQMGSVAGTRARPGEAARQTVVAGAGGPRPVVINSDASPEGSRCRYCGGALEPGGTFCPECGKKQ